MNRIKELREAKGIPQKALAVDLNVSQPTVSAWEKGTKIPSAKSTEKLSSYFGVSMDYLLGRDTETPPSVAVQDWIAAFEITDSEKNLVRLCRQMNQEGQEKLLDTADDMVRSGKYKKHRVSGLVGQEVAVG